MNIAKPVLGGRAEHSDICLLRPEVVTGTSHCHRVTQGGHLRARSGTVFSHGAESLVSSLAPGDGSQEEYLTGSKGWTSVV